MTASHVFGVTKHPGHGIGWGMARLTRAQLQSALASVPQWRRRAATITRTFEFRDFVAAVQFVNRVARLAEKHQHHPDIDIRWNKVTLALTTHEAGGLTDKDFDLAQKCDAIARRRG